MIIFSEEKMISNCCGADIFPETDICRFCYEHCTPVKEGIYYDDEQFDWLKEGHEFKKVTYNGKEIR